MKEVRRRVLLRQQCPWQATMDGPGPSGYSSNMMYISPAASGCYQSLLHHGDREWQLTKDSSLCPFFPLFGCIQAYPNKIFMVRTFLVSVWMRSDQLIIMSRFEESSEDKSAEQSEKPDDEVCIQPHQLDELLCWLCHEKINGLYVTRFPNIFRVFFFFTLKRGTKITFVRDGC